MEGFYFLILFEDAWHYETVCLTANIRLVIMSFPKLWTRNYMCKDDAAKIGWNFNQFEPWVSSRVICTWSKISGALFSILLKKITEHVLNVHIHTYFLEPLNLFFPQCDPVSTQKFKFNVVYYFTEDTFACYVWLYSFNCLCFH